LLSQPGAGARSAESNSVIKIKLVVLEKAIQGLGLMFSKKSPPKVQKPKDSHIHGNARHNEARVI
jgi:hypothetical protein